MGTRRRDYSNVSNYTFKDLFDVDKIQELQDAFSNAMGIGMSMTSPNGTKITQNSNACDFCMRVIRSTEQGVRNCMHSDSILGRPNKGGPVIARCLSAGLMDAGASIMIGDIHIASWMMGQVQDINEVLSDEENRKHAIELGIDPDLYCEEIAKVPKITKEQFERIAQLVYIMANQLSELGLKNYLQKEELVFRKELERKLTHSSQHDPLTNLYNRMYYETKITELITQEVNPVSVIVADVNYLKLTNDIFGHTEGDCLLQQISGALIEEAKPEYIVCRCGGDEFYVLIPKADNEEALDYMNRLRERCATDYCTVLPPSLAVGLDTKLTPAESLVSVIKRAEDRMYLDKHRIKKEGKILDIIRNLLYETGYITEEAENRARRIAVSFAEYLNLDISTIENLERMLNIQYMGLIVVPKEVLAKANFFIDYELEAKYSITEVEYRLAKMFDASLPVARMVSQRHEQWDGNGRPNQLKGDQIDFLTRLASVTNCYALLTERKPHGFSRDREYSLQRLRLQAGVVLDPDLVDEFLQFAETWKND